MTEPFLALAEAMHDCDDVCNANHYVPFKECATREWDEEHGVEVLARLHQLGWTVVRDPAGTIPLPLEEIAP